MTKKLPVALSEEEFIKLIKVTNRKKMQLAFLLGYGSGLRVSEVIKLLPTQVNIKEKNIFIKDAKGGRDRVVPLPKGFKLEHLDLLPLKYKNVKSGSRSLQSAFKFYCKKAGLLKIKPTLHFHSLRHGFATQLVKQNAPIHHIRTLMGHSNISTTNVYLEANPKEALKSYEDLF